MRGSARLRRAMVRENKNGLFGTGVMLAIVTCPPLAVAAIGISIAMNFAKNKAHSAELAAENARKNSRRK
jgi:hypothetical protein